MDSENLEKGAFVGVGIFMFLFGIALLLCTGIFASKTEGSLLIWAASIGISSFLIGRGIGLAFMNDKFEKDIVLNGSQSYSLTKTKVNTFRRMIVCFVDTVLYVILATVCIIEIVKNPANFYNIVALVLSLIAALVLLLVAFALKGDAKKMEGEKEPEQK